MKIYWLRLRSNKLRNFSLWYALLQHIVGYLCWHRVSLLGDKVFSEGGGMILFLLDKIALGVVFVFNFLLNLVESVFEIFVEDLSIMRSWVLGIEYIIKKLDGLGWETISKRTDCLILRVLCGNDCISKSVWGGIVDKTLGDGELIVSLKWFSISIIHREFIMFNKGVQSSILFQF